MRTKKIKFDLILISKILKFWNSNCAKGSIKNVPVETNIVLLIISQIVQTKREAKEKATVSCFNVALKANEEPFVRKSNQIVDFFAT